MVRRPGRWIATAATAAALAAAAVAPVAQAIPFGADLNLPANVTFDCTVLPGPPPGFNGGFTVLPSGAPTCTWMSSGSVANLQAGSFLAPVAGTVTQVSVRVGPVTGPMQVVVLRSFREFFSTGYPVCCTEVARTPVFVPNPNAVTTIATALPVRKDVVPDPINNTLTFDSLALSVLAPNVPVPAFDTGSHDPSDFNAPGALVYHPAVGPNQERFLQSGVGGFQVLLAADVTPSATGAGPAPQGNVTAPISLARRVIPVDNGVARVPIRCALTAGRCIGTVRLQSGQAVAARAAGARGARLTTYGRARLRIAAGERAAIRVRLSRSGKRLLRTHRRAKVWVNATVGGTQIPGARLTLTR